MGVRGLRSSLTLSVFAHALFALVCAILIGQRAAKNSQHKWTYVELTEPSTLTRPKAPTQEEQNQKKMVQTSQSQKTDTAVKDSYLGEQNQVVDRQTVSRNRTITMGFNAQPSKARTDSKSKEQDRPKTAASPSQLRKGALSKLGLAIVPDIGRETTGADTPRDEPRWANMGASPQDYVKGVRESERTALNTREYVFYGYFQRIRQRLDLAWGPILRDKLIKFYRGGRHLASDIDYTTRVLVTLNHVGEIVKVQVEGESGAQELDDAAVAAFNQAGPFPNPPKGIVSASGLVQINWDLIVKN